MTGKQNQSLPPQITQILDAEPIWVIQAAAQPDFQPELISDHLMEHFARAARSLKKLDGTTLREAIESLLLKPDPRPALQWLRRSGALEHVLPEVHLTLHLSQEAGRRHKDVWEHTVTVVYQTPPRPALRWAALFHDIGKVKTRTQSPTGKVQFLGHAEKGASMFRKMARRLDFPEALSAKIHFLVLKHLRASQYDGDWNDSAVRRFYREAGDNLEDLLDLSRADITTRRADRKAAALNNIDELDRRIRQLVEQDARVPPLPSGLGHHIMERFGIGPGPLIGRLRQMLERAVEHGQLQAGEQPEHYLEYLTRNADRWQNRDDPPRETLDESPTAGP